MQGNNIIERLFASFTDLEEAIQSAKGSLAERESIPAEIVKRLDSYDGILSKQRELAAKLCDSIGKGDWDEVSRQVGLINGLSAMIRDDARAILSALVADKEEEKAGEKDEFINFC